MKLQADTLNIHSDTSFEKKGAFQWKKWVRPEHYPRYFLSPDRLEVIEKNHTRLDGSLGDIDENGILDAVMISGLPADQEDSLTKLGQVSSRHMLVFLDQKGLTFRSEMAIPCLNCCGNSDAYAGHLATTGKFVLNEECKGDNDTRTEYRFDFVPEINDWLLDTVVAEHYLPQNPKYNLDTFTRKNFGIISLRTFDIYKVKKSLR